MPNLFDDILNLFDDMLNHSDETSELEVLIKKFKFLEIDCCYELIKQETKDYHRAKNLLIYRNLNYK